MKVLQTLSLVAIALTLFADFAMNTIWPRIYLNMTAAAYSQAAVVCARSKGFTDQVTEIGRTLRGEKLHLMRRAGEVALLECVDQQQLRSDLLASGVKADRIHSLEMQALRDAAVPLRQTIEVDLP